MCAYAHGSEEARKTPLAVCRRAYNFFLFSGVRFSFKNTMNQVSQCPQTHGKKYFHWQYVPHVARWAHAGSHIRIRIRMDKDTFIGPQEFVVHMTI